MRVARIAVVCSVYSHFALFILNLNVSSPLSIIIVVQAQFYTYHHLWKMRHGTEVEIMKCCPLFIVVASSPLFYGSPSALAKVCLKLFPFSPCSVHFPIYVGQIRRGGWGTHTLRITGVGALMRVVFNAIDNQKSGRWQKQIADLKDTETNSYRNNF